MAKWINKIPTKELREFIKEAIDLYGTEEKTKEADSICEYIHENLLFNRLISQGSIATMEEALIVASYLHNLFFDSDKYDNKNWIELFRARQELTDLGKKHNINEGMLDAIFTTVESQLGQRSPLKIMIPNLGTPTHTFAEAVWIIKTYTKTLV